MFRKVLIVVSLCLCFFQTTTFASTNLNPINAKNIDLPFLWKVEVYKASESDNLKVYEEVLEKPIRQKDGSSLSLSSSRKLTIVEPNTKSQVIILRVNNIDLDGKKISETFTFHKNRYSHKYFQYNSEKNVQVKMELLF